MAGRYSAGFVDRRWSQSSQRPASPSRAPKKPSRILSITDVEDDSRRAAATPSCSRVTRPRAPTAWSTKETFTCDNAKSPSPPRRHPSPKLDSLVRDPIDIPHAHPVDAAAAHALAKVSPPIERKSKIPVAAARVSRTPEKAVEAHVAKEPLAHAHTASQVRPAEPVEPACCDDCDSEEEEVMPPRTSTACFRRCSPVPDDIYDEEFGIHRRIEELRWELSAADDVKPPTRGTPPRPSTDACASVQDLRKARRQPMLSGGLFNPFLNTWLMNGGGSRSVRASAGVDATTCKTAAATGARVGAAVDDSTVRVYENALAQQLEKEAREREVIAEHLKWLRSVPIQLFAKLALAQDRYELSRKKEAEKNCASERVPAPSTHPTSAQATSQPQPRCDSPAPACQASTAAHSNSCSKSHPPTTLASQLSHISEEGESESEGMQRSSASNSPVSDPGDVDIADLTGARAGCVQQGPAWSIDDIVAEIDGTDSVSRTLSATASTLGSMSFPHLETEC